MALKLVHFPLTRSLRVVWAADELGLDIEIDTRPFDRPSLKSPAYLALNPLGKTPVFFDGDKRLIESVAIIEYLSRRHAGGALSRGPEADDFGDYLMWMEFGEAGMGGYLAQLIGHTMVLPEHMRIEAMRQWALKELEACMSLIDGALGDRDYMLGEFSLADISLGYVLFILKLTRNTDIMSERVRAYFARLAARDAFRRATALKP